MAVYTGNNVLVLAEGTAIASTKSNEIQTDCDVIEISDATDGVWKHYITGRKSWSINVSFLVGSTSVIGTAQPGLRDMLCVGNTYTLKFVKRGTTGEGVTGTAILKTCKITASRGNLCTGSFQFVGSGSLT